MRILSFLLWWKSKIIHLPETFAKRLTPIEGNEGGVGRLGSSIYFVVDRIAGDAVLKIGQGYAGVDIANEATRLRWLHGKLSVPEALEYEREDDCSYLLMSCVPGVAAHEATKPNSPQEIVKRFAEALRKVHRISIDDCPFRNVIAGDLRTAAEIVAKHELDEPAFLDETGISPRLLLRKLTEQASQFGETTFTHGDYCLPNLMVAEDFTGLVDWGQAGISNPNRDFMTAETTITRNFGKDLIPLFYDYYGGPPPDRSAIEFFWLLDRYANHRLT